VIILTYNEAIHIERCIKSLLRLSKEIFIVDSFSTDNTTQIAESLGAKIVQHEFINYSSQFNWALENLPLQTEWVMRMDADEYLEPSLQKELKDTLADLPADVTGIYLKRKVFYASKWIRYGGFYPHILMRIWRNGSGQCEQRWMDEHLVLKPGAKTITAKNDIVDDNHKGMTFWIAKHNQYASREAVDMLNQKYGLFPVDNQLLDQDDPQAKLKRKIKSRFYSKLPKDLRAFLYFLYRYVLRFGFLDGPRGFEWHFMQAFWYRLLVDIKITELEKESGGNVEKLKTLIRDKHGLII
jgi:glycosyltransferase involved in cell wall biosynthesis